MTPQTENLTKATITYMEPVSIAFDAVERDLKRVFGHAGLRFTASESIARVQASFLSDDMRVTLARDGLNLVVWIEDTAADKAAPVARRLAACYHAVRYVASLNDLETIQWHQNGRSYTFEAFEEEMMSISSDQPDDPAPAPGACVPYAPLAGMSTPQSRRIVFDLEALEIDDLLERLDAGAKACLNMRDTMAQSRNHPTRSAPPEGPSLPQWDRIDRPAAPARPDQAPRTAPVRRMAEEAARHKAGGIAAEAASLRAALYPHGAPEFDPEETLHLFGPAARADIARKSDVTARFSVYALNAALLVTAFPVGVGMAAYNVLGGENFRLTAQMVALTGLFQSMTLAGDAASYLPFL